MARSLSAKFGGATATRGKGFYVTKSGKLIEENVTIVKSYYEIPTDDALEFARQIARDIKSTLKQESVLIESNFGVDFI